MERPIASPNERARTWSAGCSSRSPSIATTALSTSCLSRRLLSLASRACSSASMIAVTSFRTDTMSVSPSTTIGPAVGTTQRTLPSFRRCGRRESGSGVPRKARLRSRSIAGASTSRRFRMFIRRSSSSDQPYWASVAAFAATKSPPWVSAMTGIRVSAKSAPSAFATRSARAITSSTGSILLSTTRDSRAARAASESRHGGCRLAQPVGSMHPSPDVHVSHWVTHCEVHEVSLVRHACVHACRRGARGGAALLDLRARPGAAYRLDPAVRPAGRRRRRAARRRERSAGAASPALASGTVPPASRSARRVALRRPSPRSARRR